MHLTRPLVTFDLESTGPRPLIDRIVQIGVIRTEPSGSETLMDLLINPGMPIPADASAVHGITDAMVATAPWFADVAAEVAEIFAGCDLHGFNLRAFDVPMLRREFARAGVAWPCEDARVVDSFAIFREREPRNLGAAVRWYCDGREHVGAHTALADARASLDVLRGQLARYPDLAAMDMTALDLASGGRRPDWAVENGQLRWRDDGDLYIAFGKHEGRRLVDMDDGFLRWVLRADFPSDVHEFVDMVRAGGRPRAPGAPPLPEHAPDSDDPDDCDIPF